MLHAIDKGEGFPVVLLHGFCENSSLWSGIISGLKSKYHLIAPDLPGHGKSPLPDGLNSLDQVAAIIKEFLDQKDISRYAVIGHSLGGYAGLGMLDLFPESVAALGLFHSTALPDSQAKKANRNKTMEFISKHGDTPFKQTFIPSLYHRENDWKDELTSMIMATPVETIYAYTAMMRDRPDRLQVWRNAHIPSLIIAGKFDEFIQPDILQAQAQTIGDSQFHTLEDSAHLGMWEEPEASVSILESFLEGID